MAETTKQRTVKQITAEMDRLNARKAKHTEALAEINPRIKELTQELKEARAWEKENRARKPGKTGGNGATAGD